MAIIGTLPRDTGSISAVVGILKQRLGDRLQTGQAIRDQHGHTTTWIETQAPDAVAFPETTAEVADIVRVCAEHRVPVIPYGTGTSLEGHVNAPAGGITIDLSRMNRVLAVHPEDLDCRVQPGVTRKMLNEHCSSPSTPAPTPRSAGWRPRAPRGPTPSATGR